MEVIVKYDYAAEEPDELTIQKGDIIREVSQFEEGWYIGNLKGKIGVFPDNFVEVLRQAGASKDSEVGAFQKQSGDKHEDAVDSTDNTSKRVLGIGLGNIFSGKPIQLKQTTINEAKKETAQSPEELNDTTRQNSTRSPVLTERVRAKFNYQPKQPDELELQVDDVIQILDRALPDEGWWSGKNLRTRKTGIFPDNFVVPLAESHEGSQVYLFQNPSRSIALGMANKQCTPIASTLPNGTTTESVQSNRVAPVSTPTSLPSVTAIATPESRGIGETKADWRQPTNTAYSTLRCTVPDSKPGRIGTNISSTPDASRILAESVADIAMSPINAGSTVATGTFASLSSHSKDAYISSTKHNLNTDRNETLERQILRKDPANSAINAGDSPSFNEDTDEIKTKLTGKLNERPKQAGRRLPSKFTGGVASNSEASNGLPTESDFGSHEECSSEVQINRTPRGMPTPIDLVSSVADLTENSRSFSTQKTIDQSSKPQRGMLQAAQNRANRLSSSHLCRSVSPVPHNSGQRVASSAGHPSHTSDTDRRSQSRGDRRWTTMKTTDNKPNSTATGSLSRGETQTSSTETMRPSESMTTKQTSADGQKQLLPKLQAQLERLQTQHDQYVTDSKQQIRELRQQIEQLRNANAQLRIDMLHGQRALTDRVQSLMAEVDEAKKQQASDSIEYARLRKLVMQLDAKAIMGSAENGHQGNETQKGVRKHHHHSGSHTEERNFSVHGPDAHLVNEHLDDYPIKEDNFANTPPIKVGDATSGAAPPLPMSKTARLSNPPPLKARPACTNTRIKS